MIKAGEVAFLKTTGEAVFVLTINEVLGEGNLGNTVAVRRPIVGQNGIEHDENVFFIGELESLDDQQTRFMAERKAVVEKYGPKNEAVTLADNGFGAN